MDTRLTDSELSLTTSATDSEKSWHLLALLLSLGRTARPTELASRCALFSVSPELIESLCSIPGSPLFFTRNLYVTLSPVALTALAGLTSNSNLIFDLTPRIRMGVGGANRSWDKMHSLRMYSRKRKPISSSVCELDPVSKRKVILNSGAAEEEEPARLCIRKTIQYVSPKVPFHMTDNMCRSINVPPGDMEVIVNKLKFTPPMYPNSSRGQSTYKVKNLERLKGDNNTSMLLQRETNMPIMACEPDPGPALPNTILDNIVVCEDAGNNESGLGSTKNFSKICFQEDFKYRDISPLESGYVDDGFRAPQFKIVENERVREGRENQQFIDSGSLQGETESLLLPINTFLLDILPENDSKEMKVNSFDMISSLEREHKATHVETWAVSPGADLSVAQKQSLKSSAKMKTKHKDWMSSTLHVSSKFLERNKAVSSAKEKRQCRRNQPSISTVQKLKRDHVDMRIKEKRENTSVPPKDQQETKVIPNFESYIVVEEEGSGGYGTVYRARRKSDGITVAIKCPHANAHKHHVNNELKMLERFGGKNFVIKYEGCFKNGNFDCFVLEHVEHDRPEVLKKEIDVFQLRWYGYCMFRALASLHKQGIVHRDVKPGNFLFSRKANKGYLIDFNLAMDLHYKYGNTSKSRMGRDVSINHVMVPNSKSVSPTKSGKFPAAKTSKAVNLERTRGSKSTLDPKDLKRKVYGQAKVYNDLGSWNAIKSQEADGMSGITSAKDVTSTRTPPAERWREPMPCQGRKELISLLQEAMQSPNCEAKSVPSPMRKRVSASPREVDSKLVYITPMPLHSTVIDVTGAGSTKKKGDGKQKREGPCVGTKGFRAPEVLFKSLHQGPKLDIWSAGVTLLYLIIGRMPFFGDPEQNIKDIAKLRGSEELWELAKLHNRESSFPVDLYSTQCLPSIKLQDWCETNTKRLEFLEEIPKSLFDLVDKCLAVNPRVRIGTEEALQHEFFAPCREGLRRERLRRHGFNLDSGSSQSLYTQSSIEPVNIFGDQA
ncbi:uncharacterized protein LOC121236053 [Juglans microcarpa x Juglans regia]|uniref:uncharacterized protein LOC121236053 n=1 Tax=Juglans microcarpa x Juglans regia TaxID=2249226 RepID=UPI001B7EB5E3|nr:uncharacterized protein LOC121236053 [Juglans microcarpa x Juglans regia]